MSLYRRYRPQTFQEVRGQEHVKASLMGQLCRGEPGHAFLFSGPRGVGKTTLARLVARRLNCLTPNGAEPCGSCTSCEAITAGRALDVVEIDAASHTQVEHVREQVLERVRVLPTQLKTTVFIIDEVHMLSKSSFNALLKTLEEPPSHVFFILATTEVHKVPDTVASRCQRFRFAAIPLEVEVERLEQLCVAEGVTVERTVLEEVARRSGGSMRDAESLLESLLALGVKRIGDEEAASVLPMADLGLVTTLVRAWTARDAAAGLRAIAAVVDGGGDMERFGATLVELLRAVYLEQLGYPEIAFPFDRRVREDIHAALATCDSARIRSFLNAARHAAEEASDQFPQMGLELATADVCTLRAPVSAVAEALCVPVEGPGAKIAEPAVVVAEAVPVVETAHEDAPVRDLASIVTLDTIKQHWPEFQKRLRAQHASLPLALELAEPIAITGDTVDVRVPFAFYEETVNRPSHRVLLGQLLTEIVGQTLQLRAVFAPASETVMNSIVQAFGGSVSD